MVNMANKREWAFTDSDGDVVVLQTTPGRVAYYQAVDSKGWMHCYSVVRDQKDRFWAWTYKPIGRGAKKGCAREYVAVRPRWFKIRRKAKACAQSRLGPLCSQFEDHR